MTSSTVSACRPGTSPSGAQTLVEMIQRSEFGPDGSGAGGAADRAAVHVRAMGTLFEEMFAGADEMSPGLAAQYQRVAEELGCSFLDAGG